jgi:hypothetical protein
MGEIEVRELRDPPRRARRPRRYWHIPPASGGIDQDDLDPDWSGLL